MKRNYRGWSIYMCSASRYFAVCHGVRMNANTEELLITMIDLRPVWGNNERTNP